MDIAQVTIGMRVAIPKQKTQLPYLVCADHATFLKEIADAGYSKPYMLVTDTSPIDEEVVLQYDPEGETNTRLRLAANVFLAQDVEPYIEPAAPTE